MPHLDEPFVSPRTAIVALVALAAGCGLALAACGSSSSGQPVAVGTNPNSATSPLKLSQCMRANGVPNFPDPSAGPGGGVGFNGLGISNTGVLVVDGQPFTGPAVKKAEAACKSQLPPTGPPPKVTAAQAKAQLAFAVCMRAHGVPNFGDPGSAPGPDNAAAAGRVLGSPGARSVDLNTPAAQKASEACGNVSQR